MTDSDGISNTDGSLSKSVSLSFSEASSERTFSSNDSLIEGGSEDTLLRKRKTKKKQVLLIPPDEKLRKCEKRYEAYANDNDQERAFSELLKLVPLVRLVYGDQHWKYADACMKLSKGYLEFKGFGIQAAKHAKMAKTLILSCPPPADNEKAFFIKCIVEVYLWLGKALIVVGGKYKEAENSILKSWQVSKSLNSQSSNIQIPSTVPLNSESDALKRQIKLALADVYIALKQTEKAASSLQYVIKDIREKNSENDERLIPIYSKLAKAEKSKKKSAIRYDTIVEYCLKAHEISMASHALNSMEVADTAFALGRAYANIDSEQTQNTAETYFNEAVTAYKSCIGEKAPKTLKVQDAISKVWMRSEREDDAIKALKRSIPVKTEVFSECSAQVANTHKLIGGLYLSRGDLPNAYKYLDKCLTIETELYGSLHFKTIATKETISLVQQNPSVSKSKEAKLTERPKFSSTIKTGSR